MHVCCRTPALGCDQGVPRANGLGSQLCHCAAAQAACLPAFLITCLRLLPTRRYVDQLVAEGKAYPCFCTDEELEAMKKEAEVGGWVGLDVVAQGSVQSGTLVGRRTCLSETEWLWDGILPRLGSPVNGCRGPRTYDPKALPYCLDGSSPPNPAAAAGSPVCGAGEEAAAHLPRQVGHRQPG